MTSATTPPLTDGVSPPPASRLDRLYPTLTPAQLARLAAHGHPREVAQGEVLVQAGEQSARIFVVVAGRTDVGRRPHRVSTASIRRSRRHSSPDWLRTGTHARSRRARCWCKRASSRRGSSSSWRAGPTSAAARIASRPPLSDAHAGTARPIGCARAPTRGRAGRGAGASGRAVGADLRRRGGPDRRRPPPASRLDRLYPTLTPAQLARLAAHGHPREVAQ